MRNAIWLNGALVDADAPAIAASDRGFLLADGLFETLLVVDGRPAFLAGHMARLARGCVALGMETPLTEQLAREAIAALHGAHGRPARASARITLTRGSGPRGLAPPPADALRPTVLATLSPAATPSARSVSLQVSAVRRNEGSPASRLKTLAYLDNVLAKSAAAAAGVDDAILLNNAGRVACASAANIFITVDDGVATPPPEEGAMPGIVRGVVIDIIRARKLKVEERPIDATELRGARLFLTNSLMGVVPAHLAGTEPMPLEPAFERIAADYAAALDADVFGGQ